MVSDSMDLAFLTPHFQRWEFTISETATRLGILNDPPPEAWEALQALGDFVLEPARIGLGPLRILSGYRSAGLNAAVGGASGSQHLFGEAADVVPLKVQLRTLHDWIRANVQFDQLIWEFDSWVHVSYRRHGGNRGSVLIASKLSRQRTEYRLG